MASVVGTENQTIDDDGDAESSIPAMQLNIGLWVPRVIGATVLISTLRMMYMAWNRRARLFHRLVFGKKE